MNEREKEEYRLGMQSAILETVREIRESPHLGKIRRSPKERGDAVAWESMHRPPKNQSAEMKWLLQDVEKAMATGDDKYFSNLAKSVRAAKSKDAPAGIVEDQRMITALCEVWQQYELTPKSAYSDYGIVTGSRISFEAFCKALRKAKRIKSLSK